ncbi:MAG: DNA repair protein RadC [Cytophagales bacterium]|nr:DNA repair protein RadC [Cytophagales bacterium]
MYSAQKKSITAWAEEDRPREKLLLKGRSSLSDSELIAILIGSGSREKSAVELSRDLLHHFNNDLNLLAKAGINELMKFKGIGEAKAISIVSALEIGRRRKANGVELKTSLNSSEKVYEYLKPFLMDLRHEEFWIILVDKSLKPIRHFQIGQGGVSAVIADPKMIFKPAIELLASGIIISHNHPSGKLAPSPEDINLTKKVKNAGLFLDIQILDHIIFADNGYYSFAEENML